MIQRHDEIDAGCLFFHDAAAVVACDRLFLHDAAVAAAFASGIKKITLGSDQYTS